jgi:peptide/nickel transport system permease protein
MSRWYWAGLAAVSIGVILVPGFFAPEHLSPSDLAMKYASPAGMPPFGADAMGRPLFEYAMQGSAVIALPSIVAGLVVMLFAIVGGLLACTGSHRLEALARGFGELLGALPRMVVVLIVALLLPADQRSLYPIALVWALLAAPGAMDEASAVAGRLGGARFVEALRAHGFSRARIYLWHIIGLNLRPVIARQGVETLMQVVFLEIALSYLALQDTQPSFTHGDSEMSWADLLYLGYQAFLDVPTWHAMQLGIGLVGVVALATVCVSAAVRPR